MPRVIRGLLAVCFLLAGVHPTAAQSVDEIVERHLTAAGGRASLEKLTSRVMSGTITLPTPAGDLSGPIEISSAMPNKERTLISLDLSALGAGKITVDRRFDGERGYVIDPLLGDRDITGLELENMNNQAAGFRSPFLAYKQPGTSMTLQGKEKVGNRDAYVLIATPKSGSTVRVYIDTESFLVLKSISTAEAAQVGQFEQTTELLDYRDVDGVKLPFQIKSTSSAQSFTIDVAKVEHNVTLAPSIFAKPAK